ncbi:MAG: hypothetical protein ACLQJ7_12770 [Syntrophobacteraceae bacterium]
MQNRSRFLAISLVVFMSLGIFAIAGYAAEDAGMTAGKAAIMEGAQKMMDGNKQIMDIAAKKGMKDADFTAAEKMMTDGFAMVTKGESMMTGSTMDEGKKMVGKGTKMMMDAQRMTTAAVNKKGISSDCMNALSLCGYGEYKIKEGGLDWFFGASSGY